MRGLEEYCPEFKAMMLSPSEWAKMDKMIDSGVESFSKQRNSNQCTRELPKSVKGSMLALSCVLGDLTTWNRESFDNPSIFSKMGIPSLEETMNELIESLKSKDFDVVTSALHILCHWASSRQGIFPEKNALFFLIFYLIKRMRQV
jgi:hypothetical protein